jgi:hypothetical protein
MLENEIKLEQLLNMLDDIIEDEYDNRTLTDDVFECIIEERNALEELIEKIEE